MSLKNIFNKKDLLILNCLGFALAQCHDNHICISRSEANDTDEAHLAELKAIAELYETYAMSIAHGNDAGDHMAQITDAVDWYVPLHMLTRIKEARMLLELYTCKHDKCEYRYTTKCADRTDPTCPDCYHYDLCYLSPEDLDDTPYYGSDAALDDGYDAHGPRG